MPITFKKVNGLEVVEITNGFNNTLPDQDMYLQTLQGSGAIGITVGAASTYALDHRFVVDNTRGTGAVSVNSTTFSVAAGAIKQVTVVPDGAGQKFDVRDPNWLGLSKESDLQTALTNARAIGKPVELAGGEIPVTATLTTPYVLGSGMRGKGVGEPVAYTHPLQGLASRLVWAGARNSNTTSTTAWTGSATSSTRPLNTLLHYQGAEMSLEQFCFDGATRAEIDAQVAKCSLGLLINRTGNGIGTGKIHARKIAFDYFDTAIQVATLLNEHNCDESAWYDVSIDRCGTGMLTKNTQGMGHTFYNLRLWRTGIGFDFQAGGDLTCYRAFLADQITLLKFRNTTPTGFGLNASKYHFYGVKTDSQAFGSTLVDMDAGSYYADIVFDGLHLGWSSSIPASHKFKIADRTTLQVRNSKNIHANYFRWTTTLSKSLIVVENCRLFGVSSAADLFDAANSTGQCRCIVRNCYFDDTNTVVNHDAVL
jgi:hypothetical protein